MDMIRIHNHTDQVLHFGAPVYGELPNGKKGVVGSRTYMVESGLSNAADIPSEDWDVISKRRHVQSLLDTSGDKIVVQRLGATEVAQPKVEADPTTKRRGPGRPRKSEVA